MNSMLGSLQSPLTWSPKHIPSPSSLNLKQSDGSVNHHLDGLRTKLFIWTREMKKMVNPCGDPLKLSLEEEEVQKYHQLFHFAQGKTVCRAKGSCPIDVFGLHDAGRRIAFITMYHRKNTPSIRRNRSSDHLLHCKYPQARRRHVY